MTRTYTVRAWDPVQRELTLDFVVHGDEGLAGPWALRAQPGDTVRFLGPGGAYAPDPAADWHLLVGDESALPAIARALETLPAGARTHAFVEVSGPEEEQKIDTEVRVVWLHRGDRPVGEALLEAVRGLEFPEGRLHAFVHGEAGFVKELRRLLRVERQIPREDLSISGYWRARPQRGRLAGFQAGVERPDRGGRAGGRDGSRGLSRATADAARRRHPDRVPPLSCVRRHRPPSCVPAQSPRTRACRCMSCQPSRGG